MPKQTAPPKIVPKFIRRRGGKITIDLDQAGQAAKNVGDVTANFLGSLGDDGLKMATQVRDYLARKAKTACEQTLSKSPK